MSSAGICTFSAVAFLFLSFFAQIGSERSLFDELPLNGAVDEQELNNGKSSSSALRPKANSWRRQARQPNIQSRQDSSYDRQTDSINSGGESETHSSKSAESSSTLSLFDELPNQGAIPILSTKNRNRNPRDSVDFDVTPVKSSQEFDVPFWDNRLISPIVNSISNSNSHRPAPPPQPPISSSFRIPFSSGSSGNILNPPRGPPPPPPHHHHYHHQDGSFHKNRNVAYGPPPKSFAFNYNKHHHHHPPPPPRPPPSREEYKHPKENHQVTATSGGPTVIVYAHPKKETSPGSSSSSYNPPSQSSNGYPDSETTVAPTKNEIHYHYHINKGGESVTTTPSPSADEVSGGGYSYPAPSSYYRPTNQRRQHNSNGNKPWGPQRRPPHPPPPHPNYGPPPYNNRFKGSHSNDMLQEDEDDFNRRTFFSSSKKRPADSVSFVGPPSTSYEVPPSANAPGGSFSDGPSTAYGPPSSNKPPDTSYGLPPTSSPPGPPGPPVFSPVQDSGSNQFETTLTVQTIPITRTVTELVQVPNVVYKVSSNRPLPPGTPEQAAQDDSSGLLPPVQNPPSTAYGAPPAPPPAKNQNRIPVSSQVDSNRVRQHSERPFDSHLEQILGVSPTQNSRDAVLEELLLSQARSPGSFDLTLSDLELLSLLQNSRGGGNGNGGILSSGGNQFPILNPSVSGAGRPSLANRLFGHGNRLSSLFGGSSSGGSGGGLGSILHSGLGTSQSGGSDALSGLREAFREQRFQLALQDLRKQLRDQNKENVRERSSYRSLFTRGALLLSALTLLPSVVSPMASAAGVGSASASVIPNFMLPVTAAGRRKRDIITGFQESSFETCLRNSYVDRTDSFRYGEWINCARNLSLADMECMTNTNRDRKQEVLHFDPRGIGNEIKRYVPLHDLMQVSSCLQRDLCQSIVNMKTLPETQSLALLYSL